MYAPAASPGPAALRRGSRRDRASHTPGFEVRRSHAPASPTLSNNSDADAVIIVGGERSRFCNQYWYPFHPKYNKEIGQAYWADHPVPKFGPHDGLPDRLRERVPARLRRSPTSANGAVRNLGKPKR